MLTKQSVFNRMWSRMRKQGQPSRVPTTTLTSGRCVYRSPDGLKCPVGHLIPDSIYDPRFENLRVEHVLTAKLGPRVKEQKRQKLIRNWQENLLDLEMTDVLIAVQDLHDSSADKPNFSERFERGMTSIANRYGFKVLPKGY